MNIYCQIYNKYMQCVQELHVGIKCNCDVYRYMLKNYQIDKYPVCKYGGTDHIIVESMVTFNAQVENKYIFDM